MTKRAPTGQHVKMFKQVRALPAQMKEKVYPKQVTPEKSVERYSELKFGIFETIFAA